MAKGCLPVNYEPLYYDTLNLFQNSIAPAGVYTANNLTTLYYQRMLYQRVMSAIKSKMPATWNREYLLYVLIGAGFAVILDSDKYAIKPQDMFGVIPQYGTCYGYNIYYLPRSAMVVSPLIQARDMEIGKDCEILNLTPDWRGIYDIIQTYAELLAECNQAASMSLQNSKLSKVFAAHNRSEAQVLKVMLDKVNKGEPAVIMGEQFLRKNGKTGMVEAEPLAIFQEDTARCWVSDKALADYQTILDRFDEEIGIPNLAGAAGTKMERVTNEEVHMNDAATQSRITVWLDCLAESVKRIEKHWPELKGQIKFEYRYAEKEEGAEDVGA